MHLVKELFVPSEVINQFYSETQVHYAPELDPEILAGEVAIPQAGGWVATNDYAIFRSHENYKHTVIARYLGKGDWQKIRNNLAIDTFTARDANQAAFMDALLDPNILVNVAVGKAGTGKTTLAVALAAVRYLKSQSKVLLCKPTSMVGDYGHLGYRPLAFAPNQTYKDFSVQFEKHVAESAGSPS